MKTLYTFSNSGDGKGMLYMNAEQDGVNHYVTYSAGNRSMYLPTFMQFT